MHPPWRGALIYKVVIRLFKYIPFILSFEIITLQGVYLPLLSLVSQLILLLQRFRFKVLIYL